MKIEQDGDTSFAHSCAGELPPARWTAVSSWPAVLT
jgi:hypothetical protein